MSAPPNRACVNKSSPYYSADCVRIAISIDGVEQSRVIEYSVSGGWARRYRTDAQGKMILNMLGTGYAIERVHGKIEVRWK